MNAYPFSIIKRADRACYSVSFRDANGKPLRPVSTGKKTEKEAMQAAFLMLQNGVSLNGNAQNNAVVSVQELSFKNMIQNIKTGNEADLLLVELQRHGWVKSYVHKDTPAAVDFISFLTTFWDWDTSPYIEEKLRKSHGIHRRHCGIQGRAITLYWEQFFKGRFLGDITAGDIDAFIKHMGTKDLSAARKNGVIMAGTKPLRWAFSKGMIERDPTRGHIMYAGEERKRNILTPTVAAAVFRAVWEDDRVKLANMLAAVTGMRNGEIIALQFQDLGADCIYVRSSWNKLDGRKLPKNNEVRTVEIPFPDLMNGLIEQAKQNPWGVLPTSLVFWSTTRSKVPMQGQHFGRGLHDVLIQIGFTEQEAAKYTFHGWRHFFTVYMIKKLDKKLLKSQTGHKTDVMLAHYADHETEGDREIIQSTQKETFAGLLPERANVSAFKKNPLMIAAS
jgi:integrase